MSVADQDRCAIHLLPRQCARKFLMSCLLGDRLDLLARYRRP
jgi:hypothetical protein